MDNISSENKIKVYRGLKVVFLALLLAFIFNFFFQSGQYHGYDNGQEDTISFTGHGEVTAVPDLASVYFTISKDAKTVKEAQAGVALVEKNVLDFLKTNNILEKDIKTTNASFYPKYEYKYGRVVCTQYSCPPSQGNNVIIGYTSSESITVKVRNTDDVGKIIEGLGALNVSNLNGPNFSIDNEDGLKAQARKKAIDDAKAKAKVLAKDLGVRLGKITSFNESGNYPIMYAAKGVAMDSMAESVSTPSAQLPKGENTITSDVTITYKIK